MDEPRKTAHQARVFDIRCKAIKPPPGTKSRQRLPRGIDEETAPAPRRLLMAGLLIAALIVGAAIGRFLLP
jgi:hypothetical protein